MDRRSVAPFSETMKLAEEHLQRGDFAASEQFARAALAVSPRDVTALRISGLALLQMGQVDAAIDQLEQAVSADPGSALARCDLGTALLAASRLDESERHLLQAIRVRPNFPEAFAYLGELYGRQGKRGQSARSYESALALRPGFFVALLALADSRLQQGMPELAESICRQALTVRPNSVDARLELARILDNLDRFEEALAEFEIALSLGPQRAEAYARLGTAYLDRGRKADALDAYERAAALAPEILQLKAVIARLRGESLSPADIESMQRRLRDPRSRREERAELAFALGAAEEHKGSYPQALEFYKTGNRLRRASFTYSTEEMERRCDEIERYFTASFFAEKQSVGTQAQGAIFILGMPRSGTTLSEQILASHPAVRAGGETPLLSRMVAEYASGGGSNSLERLTSGMSDTQFARFGPDYLGRIGAGRDGMHFVTNKMPENFLRIGFIATVLPNAKIVHCTRDAADTCISIFRHLFASVGMPFAYDLAELGQYYRLYERVMAHWETVLPGRIHTVRLEKLIADQRGETEKLLRYVGLTWDEACMNFQNTERAVRTASVLQVREPLNDRSVGIANKFGDGLKPLYDALGAR